METPVVITVFNRPDTVEMVFEAIRQAKPKKLLVIGDAPRPERPDEVDKCAAARTIIEQVDWNCEVIKNYSEYNLGPRKRISSGLNWVFNIVEEAIILEHDCLPHPTFFRFCEELLNHYRHDERVMSISGQNLQFGRKRTDYSYYFSHYFHCWGWASWRRAWQHYDVEMQHWPQIRNSSFLETILTDYRAVKYWQNIFHATYEKHIDTWDYQWLFTCWTQSGLTILPNQNLVSNIGFGSEATNTTASPEDSDYANMPTEAITFPLQHPPFVICNKEADVFTQNTLFNPNIFTRGQAKIKRMVNKYTF